MNRRAYLATAASAISGIGIGAVALTESTDTAQAAVSTDGLSIQGDSATTKEGWIEDVEATVSGGWSYEIPGGSPTEWKVDLRVSDGDTWNSIAQDSGNVSYSLYDGSYTVSGSLIHDGPFSQEFFSAPGPGESTVLDLPFEIWFRVLSENDTKLANASIEDTATVTVGQEAINASQYGEVGGSGDVTIQKP